MPDFLSATHCRGVSYIGKSARTFSYFLPRVHGAVPVNPCSATPIVTMASSIFFSSTRIMFWFGPWVCWGTTWSLAFSVRILAMASPTTK